MTSEHHTLAAKKRERRRLFVDIVLVLLFLLALAGVIAVRVIVKKNEVAQATRTEALVQEARERAAKEEAARRTLERELVKAKEDALSQGGTVEGAPLLSGDPLSGNGLGAILLHASSSAEIAEASGGGQGFTSFEDVTVMRIENTRLGFLMELPEGWSLAYERSDALAYANSAYYFGVTDAEITRKPGAMWLTVLRPCASAEATTSVFRFAGSTTTTTNIREASACVPPFLVGIGYRTEGLSGAGRLEREKFLLSVARTLYPIVSPYPPYNPIR